MSLCAVYAAFTNISREYSDKNDAQGDIGSACTEYLARLYSQDWIPEPLSILFFITFSHEQLFSSNRSCR
jgi:hypothetical protein